MTVQSEGDGGAGAGSDAAPEASADTVNNAGNPVNNRGIRGPVTPPRPVAEAPSQICGLTNRLFPNAYARSKVQFAAVSPADMWLPPYSAAAWPGPLPAASRTALRARVRSR